MTSNGLRPQAARLLENIKIISEQYGVELSDECPELTQSLCECATALSHYLADTAPEPVKQR